MKTRGIIFSAGLICATVTTGCDRLAKLRGGDAGADGGTPLVLSSPPTPQIREGNITFRETKARLAAILHGTAYDLSFFDFPPSSKVIVGATPFTMSAEGFLVTKVDLSERIARMPPKDAFDPAHKLDPQTKVAFDFGPNAKLVVDLAPLSVSHALNELFEKVPAKPVTIGTAPKLREHTALWMAPGAKSEVIGSAKTIAEVDWVALVERLPARSGKTCTGYGKAGTAEVGDRTLVVKLLDDKISVHEVRTGKVIAQKEIKAANECPSGGIGELKSYASADEERRWLRQLTSSR